MPPSTATMLSMPDTAPHSFHRKVINPTSDILTIDVGGQIFQTTKQTLSLAGPNSLFSRLSNSNLIGTRFIDRDPELFSVLLSLLRTGNLPSKAKAFDVEDLIEESRFYNIESLLIDSLSHPSHFEAFNLEKSMILPLNGRDSPSSVATTPSGTLHVAHGSKITSFDWSLRKKATILTQFTAIDSLLAISPSLAAAGATDFSGLQILDMERGFVKETLNWENVTKSGSTVQAIGSSPGLLLTSFESSRRNSNCIMVYDLETFKPVTEIGHYEIYGANLDSAIPATKLKWVESYNMVMASGSHSGPSGRLGNVKLWDVRSGNVVWELKEKVDCFADITVSDSLSAMFKVGESSGEVFYMDLRKLSSNGGHEDDSSSSSSSSKWVCLGDERKVVGNAKKKEGVGCRIEAHGNQVFCSKDGNIELWSEVMMGGGRRATASACDDHSRVFRKNLMGRFKDMGGAKITSLGFGGNKMFVTRKDQQCVDVWQSSSAKGF